MRAETLSRVEQLEPRAVSLAGGGLLILVLLAAWFYILEPALTEHRSLNAVRLQVELEAQPVAATADEGEEARLTARVEMLDALLRSGAGSTVQTLPMVMSTLAGLTGRHGVVLLSVNAAPVVRLHGFEEQPFDVEASGSYFALARWLAEAESALRPMQVRRFRLRAAEGDEAVTMTLQLSGWRAAEQP